MDNNIDLMMLLVEMRLRLEKQTETENAIAFFAAIAGFIAGVVFMMFVG